MRYEAILFDLDDTLLDSMAARVATLERVFSAANIPLENGEKFFRDLRGTSLEGSLTLIRAGFGLNRDLFEDYRRTYWTEGSGLLMLYPGVMEMLRRLSERGIKLGLVTTKTMNLEFDGKPYGAVKELEETGIAPFFPVRIGFEHVTKLKPHPEAVNLALAQLRVAPGKTLMVGDSAADIQAGQAAGCLGCHAAWGIPVEERAGLLGAAKPDFVLNSPSDLLDVIK